LRTIRALNDEAFDVLHIHEPLVPGPTLTSLLVKMAPVVATFHSAGESGPYRVFSRQLKWIASRIDIRVGVSHDAVELAQRYIGGEYEVLFNGIDLAMYDSIAVQPRENVIFFLGRHEPRKGLSILIDAMALLPSDVTLWIASDGPETESLRSRTQDDFRIQWLGRISDEEKVDRLSRASVFCAPSLRGESFGIVLIEAMASGAPVVSTDIDGYRNVATNGVNALLVEPGNAQALATAVTRVLTDSALAQQFRENGLVRAQQFSMDALADHYVDLYRRALHMEATNITTIEVPRMLRRFEGRFLRRSRLG
jgi:phosphatidylinositol alpha-mannosyltransferase